MQTTLILVIVLISILFSGGVYGKPKDSECPPNKPLVRCFADPCSVSSCPGDPTATCTANYCGGCFAVWTAANGKSAKCRVKKTTTKVPCETVACLIDPCQGQVCSGYPDAKCVSNYCGGCFANWYDSKGKQIKCNSSA